MYFSVIVPTYNPRKYLSRLLDSIMNNLCKDDIEIILSDDVSSEDFSDIVSSYKDDLHITVIKNDLHHGAPAYGRQNGASISTGKWICFADQDDWFKDHAFDETIAYIENENAKNYIISDFYMIDDEGNEILQEKAQNWTHGKFYEKQFWEESNIRYEEVDYCEDIALSVLINCVLAENNLERYYMPYPTYVWYQHEDSLSNASKYTENGYFFKSFPDYIKTTLGVYVDRYENASLNEDIDFFYKFNISSMMMHLYFYFQGMLCTINFCPKIPKEYYKISYDLFSRFLKKAGYKDCNEFCNSISKDMEYINEYTKTRDICVKQIPFIETESFSVWLSKLKWRSL